MNTNLKLKQKLEQKSSSAMLIMPRVLLAIGIVLLALLAFPARIGAHAALERSEPPAGATLDTPPAEIRIWFTEPLEQTYTGAELLDSSGAPVSGATAAVAPENAHQLVLSAPPGLPHGTYTVAWRTLSSADGHTLDGYFGFSIGAATAGPAMAASAAGNDVPRQISRGLALLGLVALIAVAPLTLGLFDPLTRGIPALGGRISRALRRYALFASLLALLGSGAALAAQAAAIAPDASIPAALARAIGETRYGQLWLLRLLVLAGTIVLVRAALWGTRRWRRPMLLAATTTSLLLPIPFSQLSHAAAQETGRNAALAADVLHLMAASFWAGGLFMLALVLLPTIWTAAANERAAALRFAIPRFSVLGVAAWAILLLSGLYASWLQVGTIAALRETDYGQTLLLKGLFLLPVLALAAMHLVIGRRGVRAAAVERIGRTLAVEALIVVIVLLVVGRLIGLEPAREALTRQAPLGLSLPLDFAASGDGKRGTLTVTPGVAGNNTFTISVEGKPLPAGSEGVLRFALPSQSIGEQELRLPPTGPNRFGAEGSELALAGDWQVSAIVRKIGSYSWESAAVVTIGAEPPTGPTLNPAPLFGVGGALGMVALAIGLAVVAAAALAPSADSVRRAPIASGGVAATFVGVLLLSASRLPPSATLPPRIAAVAPTAESTPSAATLAMSGSAAQTHSHVMRHATPESAVASVGTPVAADGFSVTLGLGPLTAGRGDVTIDLTADSDEPLTEARVAVLSEMPSMESERAETAAREVEPGRYVASGVPLSMAGEWRLSVRVSPKGAATRIVPFIVHVP